MRGNLLTSAVCFDQHVTGMSEISIGFTPATDHGGVFTKHLKAIDPVPEINDLPDMGAHVFTFIGFAGGLPIGINHLKSGMQNLIQQSQILAVIGF
jgi:hypothetical protein